VEQGGIFPSHCVKHTHGAAISPEVEKALSNSTNVHFYTKGKTVDREEFSIFKSPNGVNLAAGARFFRDVEIHVMGIAGDYCVHDTIADIIHDYTKEISSRITVLSEFIASLDGGVKLNELVNKYSLKVI
jgi:nicotinamidase/pyrazinamidase